ncbi:TPA: restriction endonuclease subunit S [Streptococcus pneumoniae]
MKKVKLGQVATFINGYAFKPQDWSSEGKEIIRIQNLTKTSKGINYYSGTIDKKYIVEAGDILISWSGTLGVFQWCGRSAVLNQHIFKVVFDKIDIDKSYFKYVVEKGLQDAVKHTHGSTMKHLTKKYFDNIMVSYTNLREQQRIASELDLLSKLILRRQEQLEELNLLVKSRFNEMFEEYPDSVFLDTYIKKLRAGKSLAGEENNKNKVLKTGAVSYDYFNSSEVKNLPIDYIPLDEHKVEIGDVIISRMNTSELVGAAGYVWAINSDNIYLPDRLWKVILNDRVNPVFLWKLITNEKTKLKIKRISSGTSGSMKNISKSQLLQIRVPFPPLALQNEFADFVALVDKSQLAIQKSLEELETLKKSLMQEYFG